MGAIQWLELPRDVVRASGADAVTFLQGQLSQDLTGLEVGDSAFSLVLQPQGKIDAFVRLTRVGEDEVVLDTDAGWGEALITRLERFRLRTRCELHRLDWRCLAVRGEVAGALPGPPQGAWRVLPETPSVPGFDLIGPEAEAPADAAPMDPEHYEALRIAAGVPRMGSELDESTIPAAAGIVERSVSFTKGCFTGQELVARIDSRGGNVPRRLRGIVASAVVPAGASVVAGDREAGTVTSVAPDAGRGGAVALAYVSRAVDVPSDAVVRWDGGEVRARIEELPLT